MLMKALLTHPLSSPLTVPHGKVSAQGAAWAWPAG